MLPSDLLREIENMSAGARGLLRRRIYEAPMFEHHAEVPDVAPPRVRAAKLRADMPDAAAMEAAHLTREAEGADLELGDKDLRHLLEVASRLSPDDRKVLLELARHLLRKSGSASLPERER